MDLVSTLPSRLEKLSVFTLEIGVKLELEDYGIHSLEFIDNVHWLILIFGLLMPKFFPIQDTKP